MNTTTTRRGITPAIVNWFKERLPWEGITHYAASKIVPRHKHSIWYLFGGLTLFFLIIQVITGFLLMLYYSPTPETAHESVLFITTQVPFGWLIRSVHSWSSHLLIIALLIHLFSTMLMKTYRKPREMMWISGVLLLFLLLGFAFTGYLLPWDVVAYAGTRIGTEIPRSVPVIGNAIVMILRGGEELGAETLKRLFALHVSILPIATIILSLIHLTLNQVYGTGMPAGISDARRGVPFYPNYIYRDAMAWTVGLLLLVGLVMVFPVKLGPKADPFMPDPVGIKPEWYFLPLYQTLRIVPAQIAGLSGETIVNVVVGLVGILLLTLPFLDRKSSREERSRVVTVMALAAILYLITMIILAYTT